MAEFKPIAAADLLNRLMDIGCRDVDVLKTLNCSAAGNDLRAFVTSDDRVAVVLTETELPDASVAVYSASDEDRFIHDIPADNPKRFFRDLCAASAQAAAFVVSSHGILAAVAYAAPSPCNPIHAFEVLGVFAVPELRRNGFGSQVVAAAAEYGRTIAPRGFYYTTQENQASIRTALSVGFAKHFESDTWIVQP